MQRKGSVQNCRARYYSQNDAFLIAANQKLAQSGGEKDKTNVTPKEVLSRQLKADEVFGRRKSSGKQELVPPYASVGGDPI